MKKGEIEIPAALWKRVCAYLIDALVVSIIIGLPLNRFYPRTIPNPETMVDVWASLRETMSFQTMLISLIATVLTILYWAVLEYKISQTLGKALMKIRVRSLVGSLSFKQCFIRNLSKTSTLLLLIDSLFMLRSHRHRYLDMVAKTEVVEFALPKKKSR